jgi:microcystin-dependent protein
MSCNNCFNGCAETISDQCVKYTGIDIPALGISTGDNLLAVENAITTFLVPAINGTGIKPIIDPNIICDIVKGYLPACTTCTGFTLNEVLTAIVKTVCDLQEQIDVIDVTLATLNADYTIGCLTGVTASSDTHAIVQAVITNLCSLNSAFSLLVSQLAATNVTIFNLPGLIATYLDSINFLELAKDRMIPYAPIPYFGLLSNYPNTGDNLVGGVGIGYWDKVYLCNGDNGTPDLRGWTLVGVTTGMGGSTTMPTTVNPSTIGNFDYSVGLTNGTNTVQLTTGELPLHGHPGSSVAIIETPHTHLYTDDQNAAGKYPSVSPGFPVVQTEYTQTSNASGTGDGGGKVYKTSSTSTGITAVPTINPYGGGTAHANVQPSRGCYYIMYKP